MPNRARDPPESRRLGKNIGLGSAQTPTKIPATLKRPEMLKRLAYRLSESSPKKPEASIHASIHGIQALLRT